MSKKEKNENTRQGGSNLREKLLSSYKDFYLRHGKNPSSVFVFCEENQITESQFYEEFASFESLQKEIWKSFVDQTVKVLHDNKEYAEYATREKLLSFYFTLIEAMKNDRSFILATLDKNNLRDMKPKYLQGVRKSFFDYVNTLMEEGMQREEIKKRPYISDKYNEALWIQFLFVVRFWIKDESKGFENTDAAIEKAVKLSSELMGESPIDSFIDLAKFIYQNAK